jgi:hypothetical protein
MNMQEEKIRALIAKYRAGAADDADLLTIENLIDKGSLSLEDFEDVEQVMSTLQKAQAPSPTGALDDKFYSMLAAEKKAESGFRWNFSFDLSSLFVRLAVASLIFAAGIGIGYAVFSKKTEPASDMTALSNEVKSLKEMMMLSLLEKESATERLKAVSLSCCGHHRAGQDSQ